MALVAPALLAADFARLGEALRVVEAAGSRRVHIDVSDGHFAGEVTVGQPVIDSVRKATKLDLDLHLLIERPERFISDFARAGADRIAIHPESTAQLHRALDLIRHEGARPGVALLPGTPLDAAVEVLDEVDFLAVLAADPVFGPAAGSGDDAAPAPGALRKLARACRLRRERALRFEVQVEGGLRAEHLEHWIGAGADILVGGFDIFCSDDPVARLRELVQRAARPGQPVPPGRRRVGPRDARQARE